MYVYQRNRFGALQTDSAGKASVDLEDELHGARFFKLQNFQILNFEKIQQKYQSLGYELFYLCV
jgi:hypothetical protein